MFIRDEVACSTYDNHSKFNGQHNWKGGGGIWPFHEHNDLHIDCQ